MGTHAKLTGKHQYVEFKEETIQGRVKEMVEMRGEVDVENAHVKFSYGNRKTGNLVQSVSLIPIVEQTAHTVRRAAMRRETSLVIRKAEHHSPTTVPSPGRSQRSSSERWTGK